MDRTLVFVFILACSFGSIIGFIWSLRNLWRGLQSRFWDRVDCEIIESRLSLFSSKPSPLISYQYKIDGIPCKGKRIKYGGVRQGYFRASAYCDQYVKGETYQVSVDPNNFKRSVLEPGPSSQIYVSIFLCILLGLIGLDGLLTF
jgi:hypothetical protein